MLGGSLLFFGVVYGGWRAGEWLIERFVYNNDAFAIDRLEIETDGVFSSEQLRSWAGVRSGANLMRLDLARVKRDLEMVPAIESAAVERVLPGTLRVRVSEREPIAQVLLMRPGATNGLRYTMDGQGVFMFPVETAQRAVRPAQTNEYLPRLNGIAPEDIRPGRRSESSPVLAALALVQAFNASAMAGVVDLKLIDVTQPGALVVTTGQGNEITFALSGFEEQLVRWRAVHEHARRFSRHIERLDLAVANNSPMQWVDASVLPPAPRPVKPSSYRKRHV